MKVYDHHVHLAGSLQEEREATSNDFLSYYHAHKGDLQRHLGNCNFIFNSYKLVGDTHTSDLIQCIKKDFPKARFTTIVDFRRNDIAKIIDSAIEQGITAIKFYPYEQKICDADFPEVVRAAEYAAARQLCICVDTSFGTTKMYTYDTMKLAACLADAITHVPLVLLHSGGLRILEAMLLADLSPNLILETSFSLPYYEGSTVEKDFAFAYKKIGCERVIYGSDYPAIHLDASIKMALRFLGKHHFSSNEIDKIMLNDVLSQFGP